MWTVVGADSRALELIEPDEEEDLTVPNTLLAMALALVRPRGEPLSVLAVSCKQIHACCCLSQMHLSFAHAFPKMDGPSLLVYPIL